MLFVLNAHNNKKIVIAFLCLHDLCNFGNMNKINCIVYTLHKLTSLTFLYLNCHTTSYEQVQVVFGPETLIFSIILLCKVNILCILQFAFIYCM